VGGSRRYQPPGPLIDADLASAWIAMAFALSAAQFGRCSTDELRHESGMVKKWGPIIHRPRNVYTLV